MAQHTPARQLFDLLVSRNLDPELLDSAGKAATNPAEAEIFSFDFVTESGNNYGTVVIMLGDDNNLEVFFGDNVGRTMEGSDKNEWYAFLEQIKHFSTKNLLNFGLKNINRLRYSMQGQAAIKEGLFESWRGTRTVSYNDRPEAVRLMIRHKKPIGEGDARYRYIESLYVETTDGERFKLPFTKLAGGRAMVEHVRNGGRPYDAQGQHIVSIVEELNVLSRFRRANHGKMFEGDTQALINETNTYYETLNRVLKGLGTHRGYTNYFETWNPAEVSEQDVVIENIKHMFVRETIDSRIEQALPILARIQQQGKAMKEANIFESWANRLMEGTWATPETPEQKQQLIELLSAELPVGADALNATEQLYDILGDDQLFDQLETLADQDADADARQVIFNRMQELANDPDIAEVISQLNVDAEPVEVDTEVEINEDNNDVSPVESAILRRIMNSHLDLLKQYGPAAVMAAARDVAEMIGDVEEIGSSDVSAYVNRVVQSLADGSYADLAEGQGGNVMWKELDRVTRLERLRDLAKRMGDKEKFSKLDAEIKDIYSKPTTEEEQLNEFLPALGAALGRAVAGAGAGALQRGAASIAGHAVGSEIEDMFSSDEVDEGMGGSYFVVFDDGRAPYGPIDQAKAQSIAQRMPGAEVIPASQLVAYQQVNRADAMKGSEPMEADNLGTFEGKCNMTAEGEQCPMHGLKECGYMEDLDTDGVMMTRQSNMSSESVDPMLSRIKSLAGILIR
jgi:hypothetical protein